MNVSTPPPRRRRRWLWVLTSGLVALITLLAALAVPDVQRWLIQRLVAAQPGWRFQAERLAIGPRGLEAAGVDFAMPGLTAQSAPIHVRLATTRLFRRQLHVEAAEIDALRIQIDPAKLESSELPFAGILGELALALPVRWSLDQAAVTANLAWQDGANAVATGDLKLTGGGVGAARTGTFTYDLDAASLLLPAGPDHRLRSRGTLHLTQSLEHRLEKIEVAGDLRLPRYGPVQLPPGSVHLVVAATESGETYALAIRLGEFATITYQGALNGARHELTGRWTVTGDERLLAGVVSRPIPRVALEAEADVRLDLQTYAMGVAAQGQVRASEWNRVATQLAEFEPLFAQFKFAGTSDDAGLHLQQATAELVGTRSPFRVGLTLDQPLAASSPTPGPVATLSLDHLPIAWANLVAAPQLAFSGGEFSGRWSIAVPRPGTVRFAPTQALVLSESTVTGPTLPPLPPGAVSAELTAEVSAASARLEVEKLELTSTAGDRIHGQANVQHDLTTHETVTRGALRGDLPTALAGPERALPFGIAADWDVAIASQGIALRTLNLGLRRPVDDHPYVSAVLRQPFTLRREGAPEAPSHQDLFAIAVNGLPLDWLARWLPETRVGGYWAEGESVLRHETAGTEFSLTTKVPWTFTDLSYEAGGKVLFQGAARLAPSGAVGRAGFDGALSVENVEFGASNRASGRIDLSSDWSASRYRAKLSLEADLPHLPHSETTFGPLRASFRAELGSVQESVGQVDQLSVHVAGEKGELFRVEAPDAFLYARKLSGEIIFQTSQPLHVTVAPIPLAWLQPHLGPATSIEGTLEAGELWLTAEPQRFRLRSTQPFRVQNFAMGQSDRDLISEAALDVYLGSDLTLIYQLRPDFQLVYEGTAYATNGEVTIGKQTAGAFDLALGFLGNDRDLLPRSIDAQLRLDFEALHHVAALAEQGLPASGRWVARLNGDMLGREPLQFWTRIDELPSVTLPDGSVRPRPTMEVSASGKADAATTRFDFSVGVRLLGESESDAAFRVMLSPRDAVLRFDSALTSRFFDLGDALAWAESFRGDKPELAEKTAVAPGHSPEPREAAPATQEVSDPVHPAAFWSTLRGQFDLDLGAVRYAPYQINGLRGRLEVTEHAIEFRDLAGEMFAGRWSGGLRLAFDAGAEDERYRADGGFRIAQADTARAVQTAFPNEYGSLEARIDLDAQLRAQGDGLFDLLENAEAEFAVEGRSGTLRLTHPDAGTASTLLVLGGTLSFSPELRALGRLLRKFAEMPLDQVRVTGGRDAAGNIVLHDFIVASPQARFRGQGSIPAVAGVPLMGRKLDLALAVDAKDEMAVILGRMKLLEKGKDAEGFQRMSQRVELRGEVGRPDPSPLYDLFARAVAGSKGTWKFIMRKVQTELTRQSKAR